MGANKIQEKNKKTTAVNNGYGELDWLAINTVRMLAVDMVEKAKAGHPGMPLGAAPIAYVLWTKFLKQNPNNPRWFNRDRFILSAGHGSALIYALLYMSGYDLPLEELRLFRQFDSKTPGHPEYGLTPGVEATTGPLGQGFGMGVGMALAEKMLAQRFNKPDGAVINHHTYAIVSDGDLMEGVASEAASFAGHHKLGKLIYIYDDNHISIEGPTEITFTENVRQRFEAYGWHTERVEDGNDLTAIEQAIAKAKKINDKPSLVIVRTHIGYGSPKQDTKEVHGEPLGPQAAQATKEFYKWPAEPFHVPKEAINLWGQLKIQGKQWEMQWNKILTDYCKKYESEGLELTRRMKGELPPSWDSETSVFKPAEGGLATRDASGQMMNALAKKLPELVGGSADLAPSTKTTLKDYKERNIHFGVREHAMGAIVNGMALHKGFIPYGSTFLIFSDYMRPSLRLACLQNIHSVFVFTHDSIGLGEDGPTHQPIEHLISLRAIPQMTVIRPADANETLAAWKLAITMQTPVILALTRQKVPVLDPTRHPIENGVPKGAYILAEESGRPDIILIATGSEVHVALEAAAELQNQGVKVRVVSMPSWELFKNQPESYRQHVLPKEIKTRLAIEAGSPYGWREWVGEQGDIIGINRYGASSPGSVALDKYGFNKKHIADRSLQLLKKQ